MPGTTGWLILTATLCYAGYNVFIKFSGAASISTATTTITATLALQMAALLTSCIFFAVQSATGNHSLHLGGTAYFWAIVAGICIGIAEIAYLYLFGGILAAPADAGTAIPIIIGGTLAITALVAALILKEQMSLANMAGVGLVIVGIVLIVR